MALVDVDAIPQVALPFINEDHHREAELLNELADAVKGHKTGKVPVETVLHRLEALYEHTREHFGREEEAMRSVSFPPYPVHKGEHERVLEEMEAEETHFRETGDTGRLWSYVSEGVPAWFTNHILTMDAITAQFVAQMRGR
ncbi:MAG TPA: hemerythrin family protein [Anaeromyxobacteraceae bacterium]|nr:hemerythrin family protein [Anaeromyxobacteraceae bacterium]